MEISCVLFFSLSFSLALPLSLFLLPQLLQGSPELIEPNIFTADWRAVLLSSAANTLAPDDRKGNKTTKYW